jgi:hypothetical protein
MTSPMTQRYQPKINRDVAQHQSDEVWKASLRKEASYWIVNKLSNKRSDRTYTMLEFFDAVPPEVRRLYQLFPAK